jgi:hypothetical protein
LRHALNRTHSQSGRLETRRQGDRPQQAGLCEHDDHAGTQEKTFARLVLWALVGCGDRRMPPRHVVAGASPPSRPISDELRALVQPLSRTPAGPSWPIVLHRPVSEPIRSIRRLWCAKIATMAALQTTAELQDLLGRLDGREIAGLQVLAINSLKSLSPAPDALAGETVTRTEVSDRIITIRTTHLQVTIDLQRTARLVWLADAQPYILVAGSSRPTARLLLADGQGLDLTEPAKSKRIAVRIEPLAN